MPSLHNIINTRRIQHSLHLRDISHSSIIDHRTTAMRTTTLLVICALAVVSLTGAVSANSDVKLAVQQNDFADLAPECKKYDDFYLNCMKDCMKEVPHTLGQHAQCNVDCFCETALVDDCGATCGFDLPSCNQKRHAMSIGNDAATIEDLIPVPALSELANTIPAVKSVDVQIEKRQMDCDECDHMYIVCMNACMKANPTLPGTHAQCNAACFCEVAKAHDCGGKCGFDIQPCPRKRDIDELLQEAASEIDEVDTKATPPDRLSVIPIIVPSKTGSGIVPSTLQTVALPTLAKKQVFSQCVGCGRHIRLCMNSYCPDNDLAGAIACVCDQPLQTCVEECHQGDCIRKTEINFQNYCPGVFADLTTHLVDAPKTTATAAAPQLVKEQVDQVEDQYPDLPPVDPRFQNCSSEATECIIQNCAEGKDAAVKCLCDGPSKDCPMLEGKCEEKVREKFDALCEAVFATTPLPEPTAPTLARRQEFHGDNKCKQCNWKSTFCTSVSSFESFELYPRC